MARRPVDSPYTITTTFGEPDSYALFGYHSLGRLWYNACMSLGIHTTKLGESWKPVKGYSFYEVSNYGCLKRLPAPQFKNKHNAMYAKGSITHKGYLVYKLYDDLNQPKTISAHRLVATMFIDNPDSLPQVNHKNGVKEDNHVSNLEWISNQDNMAHAILNNLVDTRGENSGMNKYPESLIRRVLESPKDKRYRVLAEETGLSIGYIKAVRCGRRWNHLWKEYNA